MEGVAERPLVALNRDRALTAVLIMALVLALPIGLAGTSRTFDDGDVSWHIAAGRWMFAHHRIPTTDPFSFTAYGQPWIAMEWLADLIYASAYACASYAGVAAIVAAAIIALHAVLFSHLRRHVGPIGIAATIIAADLVLTPFILARPHVLVWPILAGWTALLLRSVETGEPPPLWSLLLLIAWTNIHASFPLALVIAGGVAIDALAMRDWKNWVSWSTFLLGSVAALMLNANGLAGVMQPFHVATLKMLPSILEWQPSTPALTPQFYVVLLAGLGALLLRGVKVPPGRLLVLLVLLALAFSQVRHQCWFIIVAALVLPGLFHSGGSVMERAWPYVLASVPLLMIRAALPIDVSDGPANPRHLIAAIPSELRSKPVLNGYSFGGPLILAGIRPYIDGRADMFGDAFFGDYKLMIDGDMARFNRAVERYNIRWTMLPNGDSELIKRLDESRSWRRVYSDKIGVIHIRLR